MKYLCWTILTAPILSLLVLVGCTSPLSTTGPTRLGTSQDQATIYTLQRRIQERERTIAKQHDQIDMLSSQLQALKQIDQDTRVLQRPVRHTRTTTP